MLTSTKMNSITNNIREGDSLQLTCIAIGLPAPSIEWQVLFAKNIQRRQKEIGESVHDIDPPTKREDGQWQTVSSMTISSLNRFVNGVQCGARNGVAPGVSHKFHLNVGCKYYIE